MSRYSSFSTGDTIDLRDAGGASKTFEIADEYEENGVIYFGLVPYYDDPTAVQDADNELIVLRLDTDSSGKEFLADITDEEEHTRIGGIIMQRYLANTDI